jgi:excisionase family DNA binding protein
MDKLLLTPAEAAAALGIGRSTLYELLRSGTVASVRIGACRRIPATVLSELVARLQVDDHEGVPALLVRSVHPDPGRPHGPSAQDRAASRRGTSLRKSEEDI